MFLNYFPKANYLGECKLSLPWISFHMMECVSWLETVFQCLQSNYQALEGAAKSTRWLLRRSVETPCVSKVSSHTGVQSRLVRTQNEFPMRAEQSQQCFHSRPFESCSGSSIFRQLLVNTYLVGTDPTEEIFSGTCPAGRRHSGVWALEMLLHPLNSK